MKYQKIGKDIIFILILAIFIKIEVNKRGYKGIHYKITSLLK